MRQNGLSTGSGSYYTVGVPIQQVQFTPLSPIYSNVPVYSSSTFSMTAPTTVKANKNNLLNLIVIFRKVIQIVAMFCLW